MKKNVVGIVLIFVLTVIIGTGVCILGNLLSNKVTKYYGSELRVQISSNDIKIEAPENAKIEIEGASSGYFQLKNEETILYATPTTPPLNYQNEESYFVLSKTFIGEGNWKINNPEQTSLVLTSDQNITITRTVNDIPGVWGITIIIGLLVLLVEIGIVVSIFDL